MRDKRAGVKPPPHPVVPPVALRPGQLAAKRLEAYMDEIGKQAIEDTKSTPAVASVSRKRFDQAYGF